MASPINVFMTNAANMFKTSSLFQFRMRRGAIGALSKRDPLTDIGYQSNRIRESPARDLSAGRTLIIRMETLE
jgi:hypothetical protein